MDSQLGHNALNYYFQTKLQQVIIFMIHLNKTLCVNVLFMQNFAQLQKQIEDCNPYKGKF
jgi:hypothetical protein